MEQGKKTFFFLFAHPFEYSSSHRGARERERGVKSPLCAKLLTPPPTFFLSFSLSFCPLFSMSVGGQTRSWNGMLVWYLYLCFVWCWLREFGKVTSLKPPVKQNDVFVNKLGKVLFCSKFSFSLHFFSTLFLSAEENRKERNIKSQPVQEEKEKK